jgi:hypothetical protein
VLQTRVSHVTTNGLSVCLSALVSSPRVTRFFMYVLNTSDRLGAAFLDGIAPPSLFDVRTRWFKYDRDKL